MDNNAYLILEQTKYLPLVDIIKLCQTSRTTNHICKQYKNNIAKNVFNRAGYSDFSDLPEPYSALVFLFNLGVTENQLTNKQDLLHDLLYEMPVTGDDVAAVVFKFILKNGNVEGEVDINLLLAVTIETGHLVFVKYLLENNSIQLSDDLMMSVAQSGNMEILELLMEYGLNPLSDYVEQESHPVLLAIEHGHLEMTKYLMNIHGDFHLREDAMLEAIERGYPDIVDYLATELGIPIDPNFLIFAIQSRNDEMLEHLLIHHRVPPSTFSLNAAVNIGDFDAVLLIIHTGGRNLVTSETILSAANNRFIDILDHLLSVFPYDNRLYNTLVLEGGISLDVLDDWRGRHR